MYNAHISNAINIVNIQYYSCHAADSKSKLLNPRWECLTYMTGLMQPLPLYQWCWGLVVKVPVLLATALLRQESSGLSRLLHLLY